MLKTYFCLFLSGLDPPESAPGVVADPPTGGVARAVANVAPTARLRDSVHDASRRDRIHERRLAATD